MGKFLLFFSTINVKLGFPNSHLGKICLLVFTFTKKIYWLDLRQIYHLSPPLHIRSHFTLRWTNTVCRISIQMSSNIIVTGTTHTLFNTCLFHWSLFKYFNCPFSSNVTFYCVIVSKGRICLYWTKAQNVMFKYSVRSIHGTGSGWIQSPDFYANLQTGFVGRFEDKLGRFDRISLFVLN